MFGLGNWAGSTRPNLSEQIGKTQDQGYEVVGSSALISTTPTTTITPLVDGGGAKTLRSFSLMRTTTR